MIEINEEVKVQIFAMKSMTRMYAQTDEDFGRFCRGFHAGMLTVLCAIGLTDILPKECPEDVHTSYATFCAVYGSYLNAERKPRLHKECEDYKMMYGKEAQEMMKEAETHLKNYKKTKRKNGLIH